MEHGVMIKNFETGETEILSQEEWAKCCGKITSPSDTAKKLQEVINVLDDMAHKLYDLSLSDTVEVRFGGQLEGAASMLSFISSNLTGLID